VLPDGIVAKLRQFKDVVVAASCYGTGELFESIRAGAKWQVFVANLRRARDHVTVWLDVTVQRDNAGALRELYDSRMPSGCRCSYRTSSRTSRNSASAARRWPTGSGKGRRRPIAGRKVHRPELKCQRSTTKGR